jgi:hypothetical protein
MCGLPAAGGAICPAHRAPIRPPGGGFGNFRKRGSGERSCKPFWTGGIRWGRGRWRRWRLIPRWWRRKKGEGVGIDGHKKRKGTKVHVLVNEDGLPLSVVVGTGNEHDCRRLEEVLGGLRVKKSGRGRARTRPKGVYADAADDAKVIREGLRRRGIRAGIPKNPRRGKGTRGGKRAFRRRKADRKARSSVERFFGWRKGGFRRWTVRHERRLATFLAFVLLACFLIAWRILR